MDSSKDSFKRPVPVLTRENWRLWFEQLRYWLKGEGLSFTIEKTLIQYAGIVKPISTPSTSSQDSRSEGGISAEELTKGFAMFKIKTDREEPAPETLNIEKREKYEAAEGKVMYVLNRCIDDFDQEHIRPHATAKLRWDTLFAKYNKVTAAAKRTDLQQITGFKFGYKDGKAVDMTINSAWSQLLSVRGKIAAADQKLAEAFDKETLFQYLLAGLPDSFRILKQSLDANTTSDVYEKLEILERNEREYDLSVKAESPNIDESVNVAGSWGKDKKYP
jgi:gag-polypeptide of LTR copia-type